MSDDFSAYLATLAPFVPVPTIVDPEAQALCDRATLSIRGLQRITREGVAGLLREDPAMARVLAAVVGLSQERFKTWLTGRFGTAGWTQLARRCPRDLVDALDDDYSLIRCLAEEISREWSWSDVLVRVMAPRQNAGASIKQGRELEDAVEQQVRALGLPYTPRTRFEGVGGKTAPADFAVRDGGGEVLITVAVKGFDSTGSKLSDAAREIEEMVGVKTSRQFVFAVVDGQGWRRRQGDLRRIHTLWRERRIDGLYTRQTLDRFGDDLRDAARRLGLLT